MCVDLPCREKLLERRCPGSGADPPIAVDAVAVPQVVGGPAVVLADVGDLEAGRAVPPPDVYRDAGLDGERLGGGDGLTQVVGDGQGAVVSGHGWGLLAVQTSVHTVRILFKLEKCEFLTVYKL